MSDIYVNGLGAVSPAGWSVSPFQLPPPSREPIPTTLLEQPGLPEALPSRRVPKPPQPPLPFLRHPRLRRSSAISQFAAAAALQAAHPLFPQLPPPSEDHPEVGLVLAVLSGCVNYSRRFYSEVVQDPAMASPLLFPETVFNAPASHIAALLNLTGPVYTVVGDSSAFLSGLSLAAHWLHSETARHCLVVGAEEADWITAGAHRLFSPGAVLAEGAGALLLSSTPSSSTLARLTHLSDLLPLAGSGYKNKPSRLLEALRQCPEPGPRDLLCSNLADVPDWSGPQLDLHSWLGEAFTASTAWQCVAALHPPPSIRPVHAFVAAAGPDQHAAAARFHLSSQN